MNRCITIRSRGGAVVGLCRGPDQGGMCPGAPRRGAVRCAGRVLTPDGHGRWTPYAVGEGERVCPITAAQMLVTAAGPAPDWPPRRAAHVPSRGAGV